MTAAEVATWEEYDRLDPIGSIRGDIQAAQVTTAIENVWGGGPKDGKPVSLFDRIPDYGGLRAEAERRQAERPKTPEEIKAAIAAVNATLGVTTGEG